MESNYLKYLFNEDIYVIDEKGVADTTTVNEPVEPLQKPEPKAPALIVKGNANSEIIIVASSLTEGETTFLQNVLKAVKLDLDQVGIVKDITQPDFSTLKAQTNAKTLLVFGGLDDKFTSYNITEKEGCKILIADSLEVIASNTDKKKALWGNLQQLFLK